MKRKKTANNSDYKDFIWGNVVPPSLIYALGLFIFIYVFIFLKNNPWPFIYSEIIKFMGNTISFKTNYSFPKLIQEIFYYIGLIIDFLIIGTICHAIVRNMNKNKEFHTNGIGYLEWPFCLLTFVGWMLGYTSINTINVPIWLQFKIYRSSFWQTRTLDNTSITQKNDEVIVSYSNKGKNHDIVNVVLVDTYPVLEKIPKAILKKNDTVIVERKTDKYGVRTFNTAFVEKAIAEIQRIYKLSYKSMNIFLSTNPFHTQKIVKGAFRMSGRERHMKVIVYQSCGQDHIYSDPHEIIK